MSIACKLLRDIRQCFAAYEIAVHLQQKQSILSLALIRTKENFIIHRTMADTKHQPPSADALSGDSELDEQICNWLKWDKNEKTRAQIEECIEKKDWSTLRARLLTRISFGTAGLRSTMRAGFDSMNDLVVLQTAQGLCEYLTSQYPSIKKREEMGVVFAYDGRYNSKRFAEISSTVFLNGGYKVYLYSRMVATPFVPYAILKLKCLAGVMVTASHNPKEDNGYKVYWTNGAQIIAPHDKGIHNSILHNLVPKDSSWCTDVLANHDLLCDPFRDMFVAYYKDLLPLIPPKYIENNECSQLRFVYTAMHGVGYPYVKEGFYQAKLRPLVPVDEQVQADPEFPTVKYPNPEEGKSALDLAIKKANDENCTIILANDPDADRLACAEKDCQGKWKVFNGNELGALLGWWAVESYKELCPKVEMKDCYLIASTVSSKILASMAKVDGFNFVETLTGFKWMGNKATELMEKGKHVLFAFEEAIGFMFYTNVIDKDGVSAACHLATMAAHLRTNRRITLIDKLHEIYDCYGYHTTICSYLFCSDPVVIKRIFERLRNFEDQPGTYPKCILDGEFKVKSVRDLTTGLDTSTSDRKARLPVSASTQMITFNFENGVVVTLRTSGTEPKVKYYAELCGLPEEKNWDELRTTLQRMVEAIVEEFFQPKINNLKPKAE